MCLGGEEKRIHSVILLIKMHDLCTELQFISYMLLLSSFLEHLKQLSCSIIVITQHDKTMIEEQEGQM